MKILEIFKQHNEKIFFYLTELSSIGFVLIDRKCKILDCNKGFLEVLGLKEKPLGKYINYFLSKNSENIRFPKSSFAKLNLLFKISNESEILLRGHIFPYKKLYLLAFEHHRLSYNELIVKMSKLNDQIVNITRELEKKNIQLSDALATVKRIMNKDHLTGLLNRRAFRKILKREISFAVRHKLPLSLIMIDIDYFKKINDTYGHEMGDHVLKTFAKTLRKSIRHEDILARYGGEEFVLVLPNTNVKNAFQASEILRHKIEELRIKGIKRKITASFGITELLSTDNEMSFIKRADEALYAAKRNGRNRCEII